MTGIQSRQLPEIVRAVQVEIPVSHPVNLILTGIGNIFIFAHAPVRVGTVTVEPVNRSGNIVLVSDHEGEGHELMITKD